MASPTPKQLVELLKEQQEPFDLEDYLHEREYMRKNLNVETSFRCFFCSANSRRFLKRSATSWSLVTKRMKLVQSCSKMAKPLFQKLLCVENNQRRLKRIGCSNGKIVESDSCITVFGSCSESDMEAGAAEFMGRSGGKNIRWRCREGDNKELSPKSVLVEEISSEENSLDQENIESGEPNAKFMEGIWMDDAGVQEPQIGLISDRSYSSSSSGYYYKHLTASRILQLSKQFLFDFVRELVDRKGTREDQRVVGFPGHDQIENMLLCEEDTRRLMSLDFKDSVGAGWGEYEPQIREICSEIGDAILNDIISGEVVLAKTTEFPRWPSYFKGGC